MGDEVKVLVDIEKYTQLIIAEEHYKNIIEIALDGAKLSTWRKGELDLDTDKVEDYIKAVEAGRVGYAISKLKAEQLKEEQAAKDYTEVQA